MNRTVYFTLAALLAGACTSQSYDPPVCISAGANICDDSGLALDTAPRPNPRPDPEPDPDPQPEPDKNCNGSGCTPNAGPGNSEGNDNSGPDGD